MAKLLERLAILTTADRGKPVFCTGALLKTDSFRVWLKGWRAHVLLWQLLTIRKPQGRWSGVIISSGINLSRVRRSILLRDN